MMPSEAQAAGGEVLDALDVALLVAATLGDRVPERLLVHLEILKFQVASFRRE